MGPDLLDSLDCVSAFVCVLSPHNSLMKLYLHLGNMHTLYNTKHTHKHTASYTCIKLVHPSLSKRWAIEQPPAPIWHQLLPLLHANLMHVHTPVFRWCLAVGGTATSRICSTPLNPRNLPQLPTQLFNEIFCIEDYYIAVISNIITCINATT